MAPRLRILSVEWFERPVRFRVPFRFGAATVTAAPQLYLFAEIDRKIAEAKAKGVAVLAQPPN